VARVEARDGDGGAEQLPLSEDGCIAGILQVFPDACPNFLKAMCKEHHTHHPKNLVPFVVDKLLEEGYARAEKWTGRARRGSEMS